MDNIDNNNDLVQEVKMDNRKEAALKDICRKLDNLEPEMLGYDSKGKRFDYADLTVLFQRCLGMYTISPKQEFLPIQAAIWTILIDKRDKCHKDPKDLYFSQTFLGIVGYLCEKEVINGKPMKILGCFYNKPESSMRKILERKITAAFPEGTQEMLDFYINLLKQSQLI